VAGWRLGPRGEGAGERERRRTATVGMQNAPSFSKNVARGEATAKCKRDGATAGGPTVRFDSAFCI
jgi:hypothetical protein